MSSCLNLALFISGSGTTASAVIKACQTGELSLKPVLVVASSSKAGGIERISALGINHHDIKIADPKKCKNEADFANRLVSSCQVKKVDIIGQYGWLPKTPGKLIDLYKGKIFNQHPGPLDGSEYDFGGKGMFGRRVHCAVLYFRRATNHDYWTEMVTHIVTSKFDKGIVIKRTRVKIEKTETVEDLRERTLFIEHTTQIEALKEIEKGKIKESKLSKSLVRVEERDILQKAKEIAKLLYPAG